jgi:hypothetical protein
MTNNRNWAVLLEKGQQVYGMVKGLISPFIVVSVLVFIFAGCSSPPPIRPALSQTVISIQRSSTKLDTGKLYIYVDDRCINKNAPIRKGQFFSYPINNGVHYIHGVCGKYVSEAINFTANSSTVSFSAEIIKEPGAFGKTKLLINRSLVNNDTGTQTNQSIQGSYGN